MIEASPARPSAGLYTMMMRDLTHAAWMIRFSRTRVFIEPPLGTVVKGRSLKNYGFRNMILAFDADKRFVDTG
jgi:hypothetical protein